jgi:hypothetical protein
MDAASAAARVTVPMRPKNMVAARMYCVGSLAPYVKPVVSPHVAKALITSNST